MEDLYYVAVDYGHSKWFNARDIRCHGPYKTADEARQTCDELRALGLTGREGEPLTVDWHLLKPLDAQSYLDEWRKITREPREEYETVPADLEEVATLREP